MEEYKFSVEFLEEAKDFLEELDEKSRNKILYNIWNENLQIRRTNR
jgi:hypothetical protein